jgi:hypothetical protein
MKKQLLLLPFILFLSLSMNGQEVIKKGLFVNSILGYCKTTSSIANVVVDQEKAQLKVFTYTRVDGRFDFDIQSTGEAPKNNKAKLGGFMKKLNDTNQAYDDNVKVAASCISVRTLPFELLMGTGLQDLSPNAKGIKKFFDEKIDEYSKSQMEVDIAYPNVFKPNIKYSFSRSGCEQGQVNFGKLPLLSVDQLAAKYPEVNYSNDARSEIIMTTQGEGMLGLKNMKSFPAKTQYHRCVDSTTAEIVYTAVKEVALKKEEAIAKLSGYSAYNGSVLHLDDNKTHFTLLRADAGKEDKFANYKGFRFVTFSEDGTILNMKDFKTEFVRDTRYCNFVYDKKGNKTGVLIILSSFTMIGGKAQKDPKDNNHVLYYFDLQGNEKFHYTFEHGEGDNPRGITPILVIEDKDALRMWSGNYQKILKPYTEIINFDDKGKGTFVSFPKDNIRGGYTFDINGPMSAEFKFKVLEDGNFLLWDQKTETKSRPNGSFEQKYTVYNSAQLIIITPDLEYVNSSGFVCNGATEPASFDYIGKMDDNYKIIVTNQCKNYFESLGKENKVIVYPNEEDAEFVKLPPRPAVANYTVDKTARKIYAVYEHKNWSMLGYLMIMSY